MNTMRKSFAVLAAIAATSLPAMAQSATEAIYACAETADDTERLACYDAAVAALQAAESAGDVVTFTTEEIAEAREENFGRSEDVVEDRLADIGAAIPDTEPDDVTAAVVGIGETPDGKLIVTLDNGQVWRQTDSASIPVSRKAPPKTAKVMKAALGSYRLKLGRNRPFRAERVD